MPLDTLAMTRFAFQSAPDAKRVQVGAQRAWGVLDDDEQLVDDGTGEAVSVRTRAVHLANEAITGIVDGTAITIGGVVYTVRGRPMLRENGDVMTVRVTRLDP
jgi:DNA/RNA endonuclease YhcR with UshA esterase domain